MPTKRFEQLTLEEVARDIFITVNAHSSFKEDKEIGNGSVVIVNFYNEVNELNDGSRYETGDTMIEYYVSFNLTTTSNGKQNS